MQKRFLVFGLLVFLVVLTLNLNLTMPAKALGTATLAISPSSASVGTGSNVNVDIALNTGGNPADGVDIYMLHFNPSILQVVDSNAGVAGVQITPGASLPNTAINTVDNVAGTIQFSQSTSGGTSFTGSGTVATITFHGQAAGSSAVTFDFTPGSTADTNVAYQGVDQLNAVTNGNITVTTPDTTPPTVSITAPTTGSTVSGTVSVTATAADNVGVAGVQFKLDGANLSAEVTTAPYSISWNTNGVSVGTHSLTAVARDAAGNTTTSTTVSVTIPAAFDFGITNGGNKSVTQGSNVTNSISTTLVSGSTSAVSFTASGLPTGVSAAFSPTSCSPACSSTLTLTATGSATTGAATITVTGTAGALTHTTTFSLTVNLLTYPRTINIASLEAHSGKIITGTIDALTSAAKAFIKSYAYTTDVNGNATITFDIPVQTVYLKIHATPYLTRLLSNIDLNTNVTYSFPQLLTGDINQDNIINSVDYSVLNTNWFTNNAASDLNQDGLVNSIDYSYMNKHWLISGEQ